MIDELIGVVIYTRSGMNKRRYIGLMKNGLRHGMGWHECRDGTIYRGMWSEDKRCGHGVEINSAWSYRYEGNYHDNLKHGFGKQVVRD